MSQKGLRLIYIVCLGTVLRLANLGKKPLWLDEIITALLTSGQGYEIIPRETLFSIQNIPSFFTYQPQSCSVIAGFLAEQSTHPPLFFCVMHQWLGLSEGLNFLNLSLAVRLRLLPAILGILAIILLYHLNRLAFSENAGLIGAGVMAVSPFAVYLGQEARQYTLLLMFIAIALLALIKLLKPTRHSFVYWLVWGVANSLGCYTHYFFFLSFAAQIIILFLWFLRHSPQRLAILFGVVIGVIFSYLPWLPTVINHFSSSTTDWLPSVDFFSPLLQLFLGFVVMVIAFPVENQPLIIQIVSGMFMLGFIGWFLYHVGLGYRKLLQEKTTQAATVALSLYVGLVLLQFLLIIYGLEKNIAIAPRYNYVFYPAICALLGASLAQKTAQKISFKLLIAGGMGILSSAFVVFNLSFFKPYLPEITAQRFNQSSDPILIVMGYKDEMDLALGLSYGLALNNQRQENLTSEFIFFDHEQGYDKIWQALSEIKLNASDVWVIGTGLKQVAFPEALGLNQRKCQRDRANYYRIGIPYQRYVCSSEISRETFPETPLHNFFLAHW